MLVYGDHASTIEVAAALGGVAAALSEAQCASRPHRHEHLTRAFIDASGVAQGLIDAEFDARGADDLSPLHAAAMAMLAVLARGLAGGTAPGREILAGLTALTLPRTVTVRTPEGYAFYAVYPEAYAQSAAAWPWRAPPLVIGVRSIGTGLAAAVGAAAGAATVLTVRPTGHPFARTLRLTPALRELIAAHRGPFAVADEGPGLSGSSFGCVADLLEDLGVEPERIVFFPSHGNDVGARASPRHRARWRQAQRPVRTLDDLLREQPIGAWFGDVVGEVERVEDLSAGAWREALSADACDPPPADPLRERRKFRLSSPRGQYIARFAGLGATGEAKLAPAKALHAAGFAPEPLALRRGFLLQGWEAGDPLPPGPPPPDFVEHLGRYLAFRARDLPAGSDQGASVEALTEMACANARELLGERQGAELAQRLQELAPGEIGRRVHVDGRLHRWEWLRRPDRSYSKLDALDHSQAHDLIGCQDIAWDVAGAAAEFDLAPGEVAQIIATIERARVAVAAESLAFFGACYAAFQGGLWAMAEAAAPPAEQAAVARHRRRYRERLSALASYAAARVG
ncbi:MAG: hypothetical protein ACJ798_11040 [Phenylobacterium sp.]